jgi:NAD(P)-dependent dehydrogenase (short-subunit alcohol dehydrogenase family)
MTPTTPVVVTGGASGIGRGCARALAEVGRPVAIWDLDGAAAEKEAAAIAEELGVTTVGLEVDVTKTTGLADAAQQSRQAVGQVGAVLHAAGVSGHFRIGELTDDNWDQVLDVNLRAEVMVIQAFIADLRASPGAAVVGIASIASFIGYEHIPAYCASKAGVLGLTRSLALGLAKDGVRVNAICPGYIDTPMLGRHAIATQEGRDRIEGITPLGRLGQPSDIARAARFLLSDQAEFVTGQQLVVDGGVLATTV